MARLAHRLKVNIHWIESDNMRWPECARELEQFDGILVPGGFGKRGVEGMISAIRYARESKVPYFGICLGMQTMVIEFARNVCGLEHANSTEFDPATPDRVIYKLRELKGVDELGGTMRLGAYPCLLAEGSFARQAYGKPEISERHRHRYEFNREYEQVLTSGGLRIAGQTPDSVYVEICEIPGSSLVSGLPVPSRIQIQAAGAASVVLRVHRRGAQVSQEPSQARATRAVRAVHTRRLSTIPPIGRGQPLVLIAGPCVIESEEHVRFLAAEIRKIAGPFIFKASFDKANRSSVSSYRGPGPQEGLRILADLRRDGYAVLTDIHETSQAEAAAEAADILQIPAFLCRQTDLLVAAGRTGRTVNIKKGQFVSPHDIRHAADKVASTGNNNILLTERGSSFGYNNLVVDMRGLADHARLRMAGDLRRHAQRPDSGRPRQCLRRTAPVHSNARPRRRGCRRGRRIRGSSRRSRACLVRRPKRAAAGPAGGAVGEAPGDSPRDGGLDSIHTARNCNVAQLLYCDWVNK